MQVDGSKMERKYEEETKLQGTVKANILLRYFKAGVGWPFPILFLLGNVIVTTLNVGTDYWLSYW